MRIAAADTGQEETLQGVSRVHLWCVTNRTEAPAFPPSHLCHNRASSRPVGKDLTGSGSVTTRMHCPAPRSSRTACPSDGAHFTAERAKSAESRREFRDKVRSALLRVSRRALHLESGPWIAVLTRCARALACFRDSSDSVIPTVSPEDCRNLAGDNIPGHARL